MECMHTYAHTKHNFINSTSCTLKDFFFFFYVETLSLGVHSIFSDKWPEVVFANWAKIEFLLTTQNHRYVSSH